MLQSASDVIIPTFPGEERSHLATVPQTRTPRSRQTRKENSSTRQEGKREVCVHDILPREMIGCSLGPTLSLPWCQPSRDCQIARADVSLFVERLRWSGRACRSRIG